MSQLSEDAIRDVELQSKHSSVLLKALRKHPVKILLLTLFLTLVGFAIFAVAIVQRYSVYSIPSAGMEPTFMAPHGGNLAPGGIMSNSEGDHILADKRFYLDHSPKTGDIVVFLAPKEADLEHRNGGVQVENILTKRIIGIPGDTIELKRGMTFLNGAPLQEPYIKEPMDTNLASPFKFGNSPKNSPFLLKSAMYWVMGDNRNDSSDSRYWGPIERSRIIGKVVSIIKPSSRARSIP